jgi:hypothetical protein
MTGAVGVGAADSSERGTGAASPATTRCVGSRRGSLHLPSRGQLPAAMATMLIAAWMFIPAPPLHELAGLTFTLLLAVHLLNSRRSLARAVRTVPGRQLSRPIAQILALLTSAGVMLATGFGLLIGLPLTGLHGTSSYLMLLIAGWHVWSRRAVFTRSVPTQIATRPPARGGRAAR